MAARDTQQDDVATDQARALAGALLVPLDRVERDASQPRHDWRTDWVYDPATNSYKQQNVAYARLEELAESIRAHGLLQPLVVRMHPDRPGYYIIIAGHRRRRASEMAGLREVPVIVREAPEADLRVLQLVENLQRQDLTPMDEARAYAELMALRGIRAAEVARLVHVSAQHVLNRLRVLRDDVLRDAVERRQISASVAQEIKKLTVEAADELRQRVRAGDRVQLSEVQQVRARLAAAGIVNPRRKLAAGADDDPVAAAQDAAPSAEQGSRSSSKVDKPANEGLSRLAPWRIAPLFEPQIPASTPPPGAAPTVETNRSLSVRQPAPGTEAEPARGERSEPIARADGRLARPRTEERVGPGSQDIGSSTSVTRDTPSDDRHLDSMVRALDDASYGCMEEILAYGVSRGWSSAGLLHMVRTARGHTSSR